MSSSYQIQGPDITYETFESEVLIINLGNGSYHSLRGTAVPIWPALVAGHTPEAIAALWAGTAEQREAVSAFARQLADAGLIAPRTEPAPAAPPDRPAAWPDFSTPQLESYTDMQDILMLDPIHEVDMSGWPRQPGKTGETVG